MTLPVDATGAFEVFVPQDSEGRLTAARAPSSDDPAITTASALEALRMAVGLAPSWGPAAATDFIAADIDGNGAVTTADALSILRIAVGLPAEAAPRWVFLDAEADLSEVDRSNVTYEEGLSLAALAAAETPSLVGILIGHVQEYV